MTDKTTEYIKEQINELNVIERLELVCLILQSLKDVSNIPLPCLHHAGCDCVY